MPARSVCLVTLSLSEAGPGRFGCQPSLTDIYHIIPYHGMCCPGHTRMRPVFGNSFICALIIPWPSDAVCGVVGFEQCSVLIEHAVVALLARTLQAIAIKIATDFNPSPPYPEVWQRDRLHQALHRTYGRARHAPRCCVYPATLKGVAPLPQHRVASPGVVQTRDKRLAYAWCVQEGILCRISRSCPRRRAEGHVHPHVCNSA